MSLVGLPDDHLILNVYYNIKCIKLIARILFEQVIFKIKKQTYLVCFE